MTSGPVFSRFFYETFPVGAHVHVAPACDVKFYVPPMQGNLFFITLSSQEPHCPCFTVFYTLLYSISLGVLQVGGDMFCVLHKHFSPFTTLVKLPSLRCSLVPRRALQPRCPCFTRFYTVSYSVKLGVTQVGGDCVVLTQTLLPPYGFGQAALLVM